MSLNREQIQNYILMVGRRARAFVEEQPHFAAATAFLLGMLTILAFKAVIFLVVTLITIVYGLWLFSK